MNLELYRTFFYTAKYSNISKASEHMYITQPAVSRAIRQLEEALKCSLFFRTPKGVLLTPEGKILYNYVEQAFSFITNGEQKINEVKNLLDGEIRIGISDTLCKHYLLPYLKLFNTLHPSIKVHVVCPTTLDIIKLLKTGKIDFGIINLPYTDNQLEFKTIMEVQDCFVAGQKYKHLSKKILPIREIIGNPILLLEKNSNSRLFIDKYFEDNSITVTPDFELGNIDLLVQFAKYDFGISCVIKNFVKDELESGKLFEIKPAEKIPPRNIGVTWLRNVPLSYTAKELIKNLDYFDTSEF
ncbi:MAG: LysR family transcriptional regulator [Bacillota bacterium]|nr:LysR family transcriptional regulator [Bacillota bacterium]